LILHYRPVAEKRWRVFDLRPLLIGSRQQRTNPVVDAETTLEEIL
jgi:hypothetical protein